MGRTAGHIALWCGISNGSEYVLIPERAEENDEEEIIKKIMSKRRIGKKHHIICKCRRCWSFSWKWQNELKLQPAIETACNGDWAYPAWRKSFLS